MDTNQQLALFMCSNICTDKAGVYVKIFMRMTGFDSLHIAHYSILSADCPVQLTQTGTDLIQRGPISRRVPLMLLT